MNELARKEPQNIEAEINALGCAFLNKSALDKVCEELHSDMFFLDSHKKIYEVLKKLRREDVAIDVTTVSNELEKNKSLGSIGGIEYLTEIIDSVATPANIEYYINIISTLPFPYSYSLHITLYSFSNYWPLIL